MSRVEEFEKKTAEMLDNDGLMFGDMLAVELIELNRTMALIYDHMSNKKAAADGEKNE